MTKADDAIQTGRAKIRVSEYPTSTTGQSVVIEREGRRTQGAAQVTTDDLIAPQYMKRLWVLTVCGNDKKWAFNADIPAELAEALRADGVDIVPLYTSRPSVALKARTQGDGDE